MRHLLGSIDEECLTAVDPTRPKHHVKLVRKADGDPPPSAGHVGTPRSRPDRDSPDTRCSPIFRWG